MFFGVALRSSDAAASPIIQSGSIGAEVRVKGIAFRGNLAIAFLIVQPDGALRCSDRGDQRLAIGINSESVLFGGAGGELLWGTVRKFHAPDMKSGATGAAVEIHPPAVGRPACGRATAVRADRVSG